MLFWAMPADVVAALDPHHQAPHHPEVANMGDDSEWHDEFESELSDFPGNPCTIPINTGTRVYKTKIEIDCTYS